jgi:tetratricopeptide (TPR) repeat protein
MKLLLFLFGAVLLSLQTMAQCDNLKPMYGENCVKTEALQKTDAQFIKTEIKLCGTADSASRKYVRLGWGYFFRRDPQTAMKRFNQAWLLNPQNAGVYFGFGHLTRYAFNKDAAEAEKYYRLGRERDPKRISEPLSLVYLLRAFENANNLEASLDASTQLVQGFPEFGKGLGYKKRSFYYIQAQKPDQAIEDADKAIQLDPQDPDSYVTRGYAYSWQRNQQKALENYDMAIKMAPAFAGVYINRAVLLADSLNQPEQALTDMDKAIQLDPKAAMYYEIKSDILFKLNRKAEACACLRNGIKAGQKSLEPVIRKKCAR